MLAGVSSGATAVLGLMWWWEAPTRTGAIRGAPPRALCHPCVLLTPQLIQAPNQTENEVLVLVSSPLSRTNPGFNFSGRTP